MAHIGPASSAQKSRRIQFGILSGPGDLRDVNPAEFSFHGDLVNNAGA